jgi:flagellar biosynthesis protein FlhB
MPESPSGGEKTEDPTPKRLADARDEGQVAFSVELNTAILMVLGFVMLMITGGRFCDAASDTIRFALTDALTWELSREGALRSLIIHHLPLALWMLPVAGVLLLAGVLVSVGQVGLHLTPKPLMPKLNKISPLTGFGRLFGMRGLMRFVTNVLKLTLLVVIAWMTIREDLYQIALLTPELNHRLGHEGHLLAMLGIKLALVLLLIAAVDYLYQRWQHYEEMKMTKQEVKEEMKQSDGDPLVKGKIRQIQRQMAQKRMMAEVPKADVVITNPTHVAVALRYDREKMAAPEVVAKGYDEVAQRIKAIAAEHGIPMVENVPLARALAKEVALGKAVPPKWFQQVAQVLSWVYKARRAS